MMASFYLDGDPAVGAVVLRSAALDVVSGLCHGFSTRRGGASVGERASLDFGADSQGGAREENRRRLGARVGLDVTSLYMVHQVHGSRVIEVDGAHAPAAVTAEEADALWTDVPGLSLGVVTADCVPVLIADRQGCAVAAAHAGWRGLVAGVLGKTVDVFVRRGIAASSLVAAIGPHIGVEAYEIGEEVARHFEALDMELGHGAVLQRGRSKPHLDLGAVAHAALVSAGVSQVTRTRHGTAREASLFFSHRREPSGGRQLSVIGLMAGEGALPPRLRP